MDLAAAPSALTTTTSTTPATTTRPQASLFHTLLSDLNPLQYIPVVGALYRAATGDEGNPTLRFVASIGTSFALGGPLGVGITVAEKITGFDPEMIVRRLVGQALHPHATAAASVATAATPAETTAPRAWTASELAAYSGNTDSEADRLNGLELQRLATQYA